MTSTGVWSTKQESSTKFWTHGNDLSLHRHSVKTPGRLTTASRWPIGILINKIITEVLHATMRFPHAATHSASEAFWRRSFPLVYDGDGLDIEGCELKLNEDFGRSDSLHRPNQDDTTEQVPTRELWTSFPQDYVSLLHQLYCSLGQCCDSGDCRVTNNVTGLSKDLQTKLHGQHLAQAVVLKAIQGFTNNPDSNKPLTLSFHGWSGTGKNFVARMIADNLYRDGVKSECVRLFIAPFHFPHARLVDTYKSQLREAIRDMVLRCPQTLFIFDEAEKLHPGLIDAIKPFMDHYDNVDGVSYRRAIFLFLSNIGGAAINDVALDFWHSGQNREDIGMEDLEHRLRAETIESDGGFAQSELMSGHLIDFYVPFLPLEYRHIKLCARDAYTARGLEADEDTLDELRANQKETSVPRRQERKSASASLL
uniref:Uncharacterized protein n=1 Tax=Knipowitschia caucasica TaxID=637954 RepID=A0AAV2KZW4_KNICA